MLCKSNWRAPKACQKKKKKKKKVVVVSMVVPKPRGKRESDNERREKERLLPIILLRSRQSARGSFPWRWQPSSGRLFSSKQINTMGCGLRKMKPNSGEKSPGKIYSTLKRPQVETKVGVAYTYRYLDFLIGKDGSDLASWFLPLGAEPFFFGLQFRRRLSKLIAFSSIDRDVLIPAGGQSQPMKRRFDGGTSTLRLSSVRELPEQLKELYQQGFHLAAIHPFIHPCGPESNSPQHQLYRAILVQVNDGTDKKQAPCPPCRLQLEQCVPAEQVPTPELIQGYVKKQIQDAADQGITFVGFVQEPYGAPCTMIREPDTPSLSLHSSPSSVIGSLGSRSPSYPCSPAHLGDLVEETNTSQDPGNGPEGPVEVSGASSPISEELTEDESPCHNNNKDRKPEIKPRTRYMQKSYGAELLALYNHPVVREGNAVKYYTVKVPLRVHASVNNNGGGGGVDDVREVEANWLDHMTQHFNNGASLVDGHFHLGNAHDLLPKTVESIFVFQEGGEGEANTIYDAIVVEQWTVIDGLQVKADYVPLLQSLATYGWRLTCVLPTPVIKTNSDGSLATKQIVFLQRPVLGRKRKESKKLIFKPRSKASKNGIKDKGRKTKPKAENHAKILDYNEKDGNEGDDISEKMHAKNEKMDEINTIKVETPQTNEEPTKVDDPTETKTTKIDQESPKKSSEETKTQKATDVIGREVEALVENGMESDEDRNEDKEGPNQCEVEESEAPKVITKDTVSSSQAPTMVQKLQE
ncbi:raftlin [Stigmatopora nigra]